MSTYALDGKTVINYPVTVAPDVSLFFGNGGTHLAHNSGLEGYYNLGAGFECLIEITTGSYNTGFGYEALMKVTTGIGNTGFGEATAIYLSDGSYNTLIGLKAGMGQGGNTHYNLETHVGSYAGLYDQAGYGNTSIGASAMAGAAIVGAHNVGIGKEALYALVGGSHNVTAGWQSGYNITSGNNNTFLGVLSGKAVTTGSYNVIIGNYPGTATMDNTIVLADGAGVKRAVADASGWKFYAADGVTIIGHFP